MSNISSIADLEALYGTPSEASQIKETGTIIPEYAAFIEASPFFLLATVGPEGLDCSPRGEAPGFAKLLDDTTLAIPDRKGNNRVDSLRNIVRDPRVALCFLIPGSHTCMRVNGTAELTIDPRVLQQFTMEGKLPKSVIVVKTQSVYFQCGKAIIRSGLWDASQHADLATLPTQGELIKAASGRDMDAYGFDREWNEKLPDIMW